MNDQIKKTSDAFDALVAAIMSVPEIDKDDGVHELERAIERAGLTDDVFADKFGQIHPIYHGWMDG